MAQIEFTEAEFIINETNNIHFITSHADNERAERMKKKPGRSQMGWINLFHSFCPLIIRMRSYKVNIICFIYNKFCLSEFYLCHMH
jgi:hypothetical protein